MRPLVSPVEPDSDHLPPPFLQVYKEVTFEHKGQYVKGYLAKRDRIYRFACKRHPNTKEEESGCPCPTFRPHGARCC